MIKVYGIKNCNSMKKAFVFLEEQAVAYEFVDFKKEKPSITFLEQITQRIALKDLINTKGTTYKKLKEQGLPEITLEIIMQNPSIIKRPLLVHFDDQGAIKQVSTGLQNIGLFV